MVDFKPPFRDSFEDWTEAQKITSALLENRSYENLIDFDNHLDDLRNDWTNPEINKSVLHLCWSCPRRLLYLSKPSMQKWVAYCSCIQSHRKVLPSGKSSQRWNISKGQAGHWYIMCHEGLRWLWPSWQATICMHPFDTQPYYSDSVSAISFCNFYWVFNNFKFTS